MREEILLVGIGGQGLVLAGELLGRAAVKKGYYVTVTHTYGAAVRGGPTSSGVIIDTEPIAFQFVRRPDILVVLHEDGLAHAPAEAKLALVDADLCKSLRHVRCERVIRVPFARESERVCHSTSYANTVALGALTRVSNMIDMDTLREVVVERFSGKVRELNLRALEAGASLL